MQQRLSNGHQALSEQVRQGAAPKELSRSIYEDRLGDNFTVRNESKEGDERSLYPCGERKDAVS